MELEFAEVIKKNDIKNKLKNPHKYNLDDIRFKKNVVHFVYK